MPDYKRILLKLSGEALAGDKGFGIDASVLNWVAGEIKAIHELGTEIGIVLGGGNMFRGVAGAAQGINRTTGDTVGMLATIMNSLMVADVLTRNGMDARVLTAVEMEKVAELFTCRRAEEHFSSGRIVIIAGGTGNPFFTTDTAAALRCAEIGANVLLKATKVDGVYDSDPAHNPDARKIDTISHAEALRRNLRVMDPAAFALCMDNHIPIVVFKLMEPGNLRKCIEGKTVGSTVTKGE